MADADPVGLALTTPKIEALLREAYLYPRATVPEGLVPDLADALKEALALLTTLRAERDAPHKGCSLWAHFWYMGNVGTHTQPTDDQRCGCDRVVWKDREKLIAVRTGYKVVYGTCEVESARAEVARLRGEVTPSFQSRVQGWIAEMLWASHRARSCRAQLSVPRRSTRVGPVARLH